MVRAEANGGRAFASSRGFTELVFELCGAGSPATVEAFAAALPTYNPEGRPLALLLPVPLPSLFPFSALAPAVEFPAETPGAPEAPRWPSGVAAKFPRRFPAGGSGGAPTAGCKPSATKLPPERARPDAPSDGGGAMTLADRP